MVPSAHSADLTIEPLAPPVHFIFDGKACEFGLEGLVPKRADRPYHAGRSKDWIKVKNRTHPVMHRVEGPFTSAGL